MITENLLTLSLVWINVLLLAEIIRQCVSVLRCLPLPRWNSKCTEPVEEPLDAPFEKPRYDVKKFRMRIEELRSSPDEDGLYDIPVHPPATDFTGAEIVTENFEKDMDKYIGR